ncbi:hypothetical protein Q7P35_002261 [Cladosporium inversicolor]
MLQPKAPKRPLALNSESDDSSPSTERQRRATRKRARVFPSNDRDLKRRIKEEKAILISSSSEDEAPESAQPIPIPSPHISDSDADDSSLHGERSPRTKSTAEMLAREYQDALVSDTEAGHDHTTKSPSKEEENDRESYSIQCLAAEEQKIALELGELRKEREQYETKKEQYETKREQCKTRETYLAGVSIRIRESINKLADLGL